MIAAERQRRARPMRPGSALYCRANNCRSPAAEGGGSGGTAGTVAGPGGESAEVGRSASLSARARQLTPQAKKERARGTQRRPAFVGGNFNCSGSDRLFGDLCRRRVGGNRRRAHGGGQPPTDAT